MKKCTYLIAIIMAIMLPNMLFSQTYPLQVQITPKAKFTPFIAEFKANPSEYISLRVNSIKPTSQGTRNIYFAIKIQQLAPKQDVSLNTNYYKKPVSPTVINVPGSNLISDVQMKNAFDGYQNSDFEYTGIDRFDVKNISKGTRLPEGIYQLCIIAMDFDVPLGREPIQLSNPNASCCQVTICYSASQPEILQPLNTLIMPESNFIKKTISPRKTINFQWKAPISTCGAVLSSVSYKFKLTQLLEGQTEDDAINYNPPLIQKENLKSTTLIIDTASYTNIFQKGKTYVLQVTASTNDPAIDVLNDGKSKACSFIYGENLISKDILVKDKFSKDIKKDITDNKGEDKAQQIMMQSSFNIDCGVAPPAEMTLIETVGVGDNIKIGNYTMTILTVNKKDGGAFSGTGKIQRPSEFDLGSFNWVSVLVKFDTLVINKNKEVIGGFAQGVSADGTNSKYANFFGSFGTNNTEFINNYLNGAVSAKSTKSFDEYINTFQKNELTSSGKASLPEQKFPLQVSIDGYSAAISNMIFSPKGAIMSLLLFCQMPDANMNLCFGAYNVCMNNSFNKNMKIELLSPIEFGIGDKNMMSINAGNKTYMQWKDGKFDNVNIDANIILSKEKYVNIGNESEPVKINLSTTFKKWDDWIAAISIDKFAVKGYEDLAFEVQEAYYDHSSSKDEKSYLDAVNSMRQKVKNDYKEENIGFETNGTYRGIFIKKASVNLPNIISSSNDGKPVIANFENAMLNDKGFTTVLSSENLIDLKTGTLGGWAFSVDAFKAFFLNSNFKSASLNGKFEIPLLQGQMNYTLLMDKNSGGNKEYSFVVDTKDGMTSKFLEYLALKIDNTSKIEGKYNGSDFQLSASLNGSLNINIKDKINIQAMKFEGMKFANYRSGSTGKAFDFSWGDMQTGVGQAPYSGNKGVGKGKGTGGNTSNSGSSTQSSVDFKFDVAGFTAGITNVKFIAGPKGKAFVIGVELPVEIGLGEGEINITGKMTGSINTDINYSIDNGKFKFDDYKVNYKLGKVEVGSKLGPLDIKGSLEIFNEDITFGNGFLGNVSCTFPMDIGIFATVQFGKVKSGSSKMQYWYVDAGVNFGEKGIDIVPPLALSGFAGGMWYNMSSGTNTEIKIPDKQIKEEDMQKQLNSTSTVGSTSSGYSYIPKSGAFGFKAQISFMSTAGKNVFNGDLALVADFQGKNFESIALLGNLRALGTGNSYVVNAQADMSYNIPNKHFHLGVDVNASIGGIAKVNVPFILDVKGIEKKFYTALGEPLYDEKGKALSISILNIRTGVIDVGLNAKGYFVFGNVLPYPMPEIPDKILNMLSLADKMAIFNAQQKTNRSLENPKGGMMLGTRIDGHINVTLGPFFANVEALAGFDLAMRDESETICGSGKHLSGIAGTGLYCRGQVYAHLAAACGVRVKFFGKTVKANFAEVESGTLMRAGFSDPTWMKGKVILRGKALGGMLSFNTTLGFSIGEECTASSDPLKDLEFVEDVKPGYPTIKEALDGEKASVYTNNVIACNVKFNQDFKLTDDNTNERLYRFKFQDAKNTIFGINASIYKIDEKGNKLGDAIYLTAETKKDLNTNKSFSYTLAPINRLEPKTLYMVEIHTRASEYRTGVNGENYKEHKWYRDPLDENNKPYVATKHYTYYFKTGELPTKIEVKNILASYPHEDQVETFIDNKHSNYIVLAKEQDYLFQDCKGPKSMFGKIYNMTDKKAKPIDFNYTYGNIPEYWNARGIKYKLPNNLTKGHIYRVIFYKQAESFEVAKYNTKNISKRFQQAGKTQEKVSRQWDHIKKEWVYTRETVYVQGVDVEYKETEQQKRQKERGGNVKNIFELYFRVSNYYSLDYKMREMEMYKRREKASGKDGGYGIRVKRWSQGGTWQTFLPYETVVLKLPAWTTAEEIWHYKPFNESQYSDHPMLQVQATDYYSTGYDWFSAPEFWHRSCKKFLSRIKKIANNFDLPFTGNFTADNVSGMVKPGSMIFEQVDKIHNYRIISRSTPLNQFLGRLTTAEKQGGHLRRGKPSVKYFTYHYKLVEAVAWQYLFASVTARTFVQKEIFKNCGKKGKNKVNRYTLAENQLKLTDDYNWGKVIDITDWSKGKSSSSVVYQEPYRICQDVIADFKKNADAPRMCEDSWWNWIKSGCGHVKDAGMTQQDNLAVLNYNNEKKWKYMQKNWLEELYSPTIYVALQYYRANALNFLRNRELKYNGAIPSWFWEYKKCFNLK